MRDKDFFDSNIDMDRVETVLMETISKLTLSEILKMVREISHDMVCYYDEQTKGKIYQDSDYDKEHQLQACQLQRLLSSACDLFEQSIVQKRKFEEGYLDKWVSGGALEYKIKELYKVIDNLEEQIQELTARNQLLEDGKKV